MLGLRRKRRQLCLLNLLLAIWFLGVLFTKTTHTDEQQRDEEQQDKFHELEAKEQKQTNNSHEKIVLQQKMLRRNQPLANKSFRVAYQPALPPDYDPAAPGQDGRGVAVPDEYKEVSKKLFKKNEFNLWASDKISLRRVLPDFREPMCKNRVYPINLPQTTIVIVFHNEALSTLLRTIHSVLDRSAPDLLREIIVVDDYSDLKGREKLQKPLETSIAKLQKVTLIRNKKRQGLTRSRLVGYRHATASVITFLDAHCEVTIGWLEPLLERIAIDKSIVVCPEIDVISDTTFEYRAGNIHTVRGIFNWRLDFKWRRAPLEEQKRRKTLLEPLRSPTMAGGLFAIDRDYFQRIGTYDDQMEIWGGENLEMSFRIWQCGGTLEIIPCSHVGHVFRTILPYKFAGGIGKAINKNLRRTAEVWMDDYKEFVYQARPELLRVSYGNVTDRLELRNRLNCKSFKWYLENVFTDALLPNETALAKGKVRNPNSNMCLNTLGRQKGSYLGLSSCELSGKSMEVVYTVYHELVNNEMCFDVSASNPVKIDLLDCHSMGGNQIWLYTKNQQLRHQNSKFCLDRGKGINPIMLPCSDSKSQIWQFDQYFPNVIPKPINN